MISTRGFAGERPSPRNLQLFALGAAVCWAAGLDAAAFAQTGLPVIVTYEIAKQRAAAAARDPKAFWIVEVLARLENRKPSVPYALRRTVHAVIGFTVARDGHLVSRTINKSSGIAGIDAAALKMVERAGPFPPMPRGLLDDEISFALPLSFR